MSFHEIRFPIDISRGASGGPERRTDVVVLGSGREERNARWADSRRTYNAAYGIKTLDQLHHVIAFFEERRGRLHGFRWKDHADFRSGPPGAPTTHGDQALGEGDGVAATFQLVKTYGAAHLPWQRTIAKPVEGTVKVAVNGTEKIETVDFVVDHTSGLVTFVGQSVPGPGDEVTAGFEFDVPVRFDVDLLEISVHGVAYGAIPAINIVEIRP